MTEDPILIALIAGCRKKHEPSQIELYRHFYRYGMGICLRYAPNRESALEMLNDGFLRVFLKIDQYKANYPFKPWLRKILVNAAIDHYRKYKQNQVKEGALLAETKQASTYNEALDQLAYDDLLQAMQLLPNAYRIVFNLYVVDGFTHPEIAKQLGISVGTSKSNLARARQKMKVLIKQLWTIDIKQR